MIVLSLTSLYIDNMRAVIFLVLISTPMIYTLNKIPS